MKKIFNFLAVLLIFTVITSCGKSVTPKTMILNGVEYDSKFVLSGYYFDKASLSEIQLSEMINKIEVIEKPKNLGEVILPDFSTITLVNNKKTEITEADIEAEIERERDGEIVYNPLKVKREAKLKDRVTIDFKGFVDGKEFEGGSGEDQQLILGSGQFIPGFEEKIVGHKAGSKFNIDVVFPIDYVEDLAGKNATFEIVIKSIDEATIPEVDDEFVKKHTTKDATTVLEYREEIKARLEDKQVFMNNQNLIYQLYDKLISDSKFYPTEEACAWEFSMILNNLKNQAAASGMQIEQMLSSGGSIKEALQEIKDSVPQYIGNEMIIDYLMKKNKIDVTENDVKEWFKKMADAMGYGAMLSYDDYKNYLGYEGLKNSVIQEKILLNIVKECNIVDGDEENQ